MKDFPGTLLEFEHWFRTEEACRDYLIRLRWPSGFKCARCGTTSYWTTARGVLHCKGCRAEVSVTGGTIFHGSRVPLRTWFRIAWLVTNQKGGISATGLQRALGLGGYQTAWTCLHKLRRAMVRPGRDLLSGEVEVDETFVGGREPKGGRRHLGNKSLVMVAAEVRGAGIGRIRLQRVTSGSKENLLGFVRETVSAGATVITDGLMVYAGLDRLGFDYRPRPARNGREEASRLLPRVHRIASLLKRWILGTHQGAVSGKQLDSYLNEFVFRFNRRLSAQRGMLFYRVLQQTVIVKPTPYRKIVGGSRLGH